MFLYLYLFYGTLKVGGAAHPLHRGEGGVGLTALASALRQLPKLERLFLNDNQIGDQGLASLLAPPTAGVLTSLKDLSLQNNQITDEGCAALASALRNGALPVLKTLDLGGNPASIEARTAVQSALSAVRASLPLS